MLKRKNDFCDLAFCPGKSMEFVKSCIAGEVKSFSRVAYATTEEYRVFLVFGNGGWTAIPYFRDNGQWVAVATRDVKRAVVTEGDLASEQSIFDMLAEVLSFQFPKAEEGYRAACPKMEEVLGLLKEYATTVALDTGHIPYSTDGDHVEIWCDDGVLRLACEEGKILLPSLKRRQVAWTEILADKLVAGTSAVFNAPGKLVAWLKGRTTN